MSTPTLTTVPTKKLAPSPDNPRGEIDRSGEEFAGLCVSIEAVGLVQPILVAAANGNGKHTILDGHRRHAAALEAKLDEIPVLVLPDGVSEKVARLTANIQREDFSPIAKARGIKELQDEGMTQVQAGDVLGKSERWVREYLRLLRLPEKTQAAYDAGALPIESLVPVEKVAKQAPRAAEVLAEAAEDDEGVRKAIGADDVAGVLNHLIVEAAEEPEKDGGSKLGCLVRAGGQKMGRPAVTYEALVLAGAPHDDLKAIKNLIDEAKKAEGRLRKLDAYAYYGHPDQVWIDEEDRDAAKTFGCLLEIDGASYITDAAWLADRFKLHVEAELDEIESRIQAKKASKSKDKPEKGSPEEEKAAKEARKRQREAEQDKRGEIRANNLELGQRTERALRSPKLSLDEAKLLALMVIGKNATSLGGGGLIWCYHEYQDEQQLNNGRTKVTYASGSTAGEDLVGAVLAAKKPDEALGLVLRSLVLTEFADQECVAQSNRSPHSIRYSAADDCVDELVHAIAEKRKVLPDAIQAAVEERRQIEVEDAERWMLERANSTRAKAGTPRSELLNSYRATDATIDQAVAAKHLKEHDGDEPSYTITAAGKKRLEKLKAAEKERQAAQ